jgi:N-acetylgalactosamine 4-sulfate 6-O-sulfotransferase
MAGEGGEWWWQMLILKSEEYYTDVKGSLQRVVGLLGMEEPTVDEWQLMLQQEPNNQRQTSGKEGAQQGDMLPKTRELLDDFYRPFNEMLAELLQDTKWKWMT